MQCACLPCAPDLKLLPHGEGLRGWKLNSAGTHLAGHLARVTPGPGDLLFPGPVQDYGTVIGMGTDYPFLWIAEGETGHVHLAFKADTIGEVDAFHKAALAAGGKDNGAPGIRSEYSENYYAAYVLDSNGHNIEAVCHVRR